MNPIWAVLGCIAFGISITGCKKRSTVLMITGQCLGVVVLGVVLIYLTNN